MGALSVYLDTSVVVPLFLPDIFLARTTAYLATGPINLLVSDFVAAEFASVVGIRLRQKTLSIDDARASIASFDAWAERISGSVRMQPADLDSAQTMLRRLDLVLRTPDAISLAIAQRLGAELATFDTRMADCARALGISVVVL
jgi:predicted nucleic acid-binding protein